MKSTNIYKTKPNETEAWFTLPFMPAGQEMDWAKPSKIKVSRTHATNNKLVMCQRYQIRHHCQSGYSLLIFIYYNPLSFPCIPCYLCSPYWFNTCHFKIRTSFQILSQKDFVGLATKRLQVWFLAVTLTCGKFTPLFTPLCPAPQSLQLQKYYNLIWSTTILILIKYNHLKRNLPKLYKDF